MRAPLELNVLRWNSVRNPPHAVCTKPCPGRISIEIKHKNSTNGPDYVLFFLFWCIFSSFDCSFTIFFSSIHSLHGDNCRYFMRRRGCWWSHTEAQRKAMKEKIARRKALGSLRSRPKSNNRLGGLTNSGGASVAIPAGQKPVICVVSNFQFWYLHLKITRSKRAKTVILITKRHSLCQINQTDLKPRIKRCNYLPFSWFFESDHTFSD